MNCAVSLAQVHGSQAGVDAVEAIAHRETLGSYYLLYAVRAEFESQLQNHASAAKHLRRALELAELKSEQALLSKRLQEFAV